jgi:hypothetical protein
VPHRGGEPSPSAALPHPRRAETKYQPLPHCHRERTWRWERPAARRHVSPPGRPGRDRVYRPTGWWTPAVHALLRHLQTHGFRYAPRVLGVDGQGREILTHIPGRSGREGWAAIVDDRGLASFARLLRAYHDAVRGFRPPAGVVWACTDAPLGVGELICHGDFGPWNLVWRGRQPVGILDWDLAGPGPPMDDVAYAPATASRSATTGPRCAGWPTTGPPTAATASRCSPTPMGWGRPPGWSTRLPAGSAWTWYGSAPWPSGGCSPGELGRRRLPGRAGGTSSLDRATPRVVRVTVPPTPVNLHRHRQPNAQHPLINRKKRGQP